MRSFAVTSERALEWRSIAIDQGHPAYADFAGGCTDPRPVLARSFRANIVLHFKCRRCDACKARTQRLWAARCKSEIMLWKKSWFCTLTLGPSARLAAAAAAERAGQFRALYSADKWERVEALAPWVRKELQRFMYRLRRKTRERPWAGPGWRYFAAVEPHRDGTPHIHVVLHDMHGRLSDDERTWRQLARIWPHGFVDRQPAEQEDAWYVAKYTAKAPAGLRTMASRHYGQPDKLVQSIIRTKRKAECQSASDDATTNDVTTESERKDP